jgi:hypothetical protein
MMQQWMILVDLSNCVDEVTAYVIQINFVRRLYAIFAINVLCPAVSASARLVGSYLPWSCSLFQTCSFISPDL